MRIAQVAPLIESVPSIGYGGTERAVSYLTEELVALGHEVTLFASGDSRTEAKLIPMCDSFLRSQGNEAEHNAYLYAGLEKLFRDQDQFDIIHFHTGYTAFPYVRRSDVATVTTIHGRLDIPGLDKIVEEYKDVPLVAISRAQKIPAPSLNWVSTIAHGLPHDLYSFTAKSQNYLCFVGRIAQEKGIEEAISIANKTGMQLKIAAKVDYSDRAYYESIVKPMIDSSPDIQFLGEVNDTEKNELMGNALGLLFPTMCNESFGLAMIEAMACGTPVIAFNNGAVPEVLEDGVTGFICRSVDEAASKVALLGDLDRESIRHQFDLRFSIGNIANQYVRMYRRLKAQHDRSKNRQRLFRATIAVPNGAAYTNAYKNAATNKWPERFRRYA